MVETRRFAAGLELVGFLGVGETWEGLRRAALIHFNFDGALGFGAGFAEQGKRGDGFVVNLSNQIRFAGIVFLPDLANLDFSNRHSTNVDRFWLGVNNSAKARFAGETFSTRQSSDHADNEGDAGPGGRLTAPRYGGQGGATFKPKACRVAILGARRLVVALRQRAQHAAPLRSIH